MENEKKDVTGDAPKKEEPVNEESSKEKTVKEVFDSLNEDQKNLLYAMVAEALEEGDNNKNDDEGEKKEMKHNVFENENNAILMHQARKEFEEAVIKDAKTFGSMKESLVNTWSMRSTPPAWTPKAKSTGAMSRALTASVIWTSCFLTRRI